MNALFIAYMPRILPDELLYSLLARTVALNAILPPRRCMADFFGTYSGVPSVDLPSRLRFLHERLGSFSPGSNVKEILDRGTTYPYHRPFLSVRRDRSVQRLLIEGERGSVKTALGVVANGFGARATFRYCHACIEEDIARFGTSYWHRDHHLPEVTCCRKHAIALNEYVPTDQLTNRHRFVLPSDTPRKRIAERPAGMLARRFASLSADLLHRNIPVLPTASRLEAYVRRVDEKGFLNASGKICFDSLASALRQDNDDFTGFPHSSRLLSSESTPLAWLRTIFRKPETSVHPVCHLLLIQFLFGSLDGFVDVTVAKCAKADHTGERKNASVHEHEVETTSQLDRLLVDTTLSCRTVARLSGQSVHTIVKRRRRAGVPVSGRRKKLKNDVIREIRTNLARGDSAVEVARACGISLPTVYRVRYETSELANQQRTSHLEAERVRRRKNWCHALSVTAGEGVKRARAIAPADFAWLYRHDRAWLEDNNASAMCRRPAKSRVNWDERDEKLTVNLENRLKMIELFDVPRRVSATMLYQYLGIAMVRSRLSKLPRLKACIDRNAESRNDYAQRRIDRAIEQSATSGDALTLWKIQRQAGIRHWSRALKTHALARLNRI